MKANQDRMSDYVRWALWESTSPMELTRRHQKWKSSLNSSYSNVFPSSVQESEYERKNLAVNSSINNVMLNKVQALTHRTDRVSLLDETMHIHGNSLSELPNPNTIALAMADSGNSPLWTNFYTKESERVSSLNFCANDNHARFTRNIFTS